VYHLLGVGALRSRLQVAEVRGLTPFTGREDEIAELRATLARARLGDGQVVTVEGEPGIGKSRLCWELFRSPHTHGWTVLEGSAVSWGQGIPYLPFIELLKGVFRVERDETSAVREKIRAHVQSLDSDLLSSTLPAVFSLLDLSIEDAVWDQLAPAQRRRRILDGIAGLLLRMSAVRPLVILIEDLHWIDSESQLLLETLVDRLVAARILLLLTHRPKYAHSFGAKPYHRHVHVRPLAAAGADYVLASLMGRARALDPLKQTLIARGEGNPLFLEEGVRTLVETEALLGEPGDYRMSGEGAAIQMPPTVQGILAARVDRLSLDDKHLLQAASAIGKDVPFAQLEAIAELSADDLRDGPARLQAAGFLYEAQFSEPHYTFKHALTQDVAYGSVLRDRRRRLHARIVRAIERLYAERLDELVDELAHHATRGELWPDAVRYLRRAGARAIARSAHRQARAFLEQALAALAHLPDTRENIECAIDIRLEMRPALVVLADLARVGQVLAEAETLADRLDDKARSAKITHFLSIHCMVQADHHGALAYARKSAASDYVGIQAHGYTTMASSLHSLGEFKASLPLFRKAIAIVRSDFRGEQFGQLLLPSVYARSHLAQALAELGSFDEGESVAREGVQIADSPRYPAANIVYALAGLGRIHIRRGEVEDSTAVHERALQICREMELAHYLAPHLAGTYILCGRVSDAITLMEETKQNDEKSQLLHLHARTLAVLSEAMLLAGQAHHSLPLAQRAFEVAHAHSQRGIEAWTLLLLGKIAAHSPVGDIKVAAERYRDALAIAVASEMRPLAAHCHVALGKLHARNEGGAQAREHLARGTALYRDLGMTYWLDKAEAETAQP